MKYFFASVRALFFLTLALVLPLTACLTANRQPEIAAHTSTIAVRGPDSLPIDVLEYTWTFLNYGHHLRLAGLVRNNSEETYQSVSLKTALFDGKGAVVAQGVSTVYPAYLRPGGEGSFDMVAVVVSTGRNLTDGHLLTTAQTSGR